MPLGAVVAAALTAGVWCVVCAGCASHSGVRVDSMGLPINKAITQLELSSHPEAQLRYPGSVVVKVVGSNEVATRDTEPDPAYVGAILTTTATASELYAWYARWLTARGYRQVTYYRMSDQTSGVAWRAPGGREQVQIGVFNSTAPTTQLHLSAVVPPGGALFEEVFVGYRVATR